MNTAHTKRAFWHDYYSRSIYFITINKRPDAPIFGYVRGDCNAPKGSPDYPSILKTDIGREVKKMIYRLREIIPYCQLLQYVVMPDHIHFLIFIQKRTPLHLGNYISQFKNELKKKLGMQVFNPGYNDQILGLNRNLDTIYNYIRENPYRLAIRQQKCSFFCRCDSIRLAGKRYMAYGNLQILKYAFKEAIIIHRIYDDNTVAELTNRWLLNAQSGGVSISPFISAKEKEIRGEIEKVGGAVVLIKEKPFPQERFKPAKHDFDQCAKGELVILAPAEEDWSEGRKTIPRTGCKKMNELAEYLAYKMEYRPRKS